MTNSIAKHTDGPWVVQNNKWDETQLIVQAGQPTNRVLASFGSEDEPLDGVDRANAALIAAAPQMLSALKQLCNSYPTTFELAEIDWPPKVLEEMIAAYAKGRKAIAKATA